MSAPAFVHLRLHSEYSIVDGTVRIDQAIGAAVADAMPALALTDLGNAFGLVKFYKAARAAGVKPLWGCDVWLTHDAERDAPFRALFLAQTRAGYLRLAEWLTRAYRGNAHRGRAELRREWFDEGTDGLIALSGARDGDVGQMLLQGHRAGAAKAAREWAGRFPGRYYLEVQRAGRDGDDELVAATVDLARGARPAGRRDTPGPVPASRRFSRARGARVHLGRPCAVRSAAPEAVHAGAAFPNAGRDGRRVRRSAGGARELGGDRAALQFRAAARPELPARVSDACGRHARRSPATRGRSGAHAPPRGALPRSRRARGKARGLRRAARLRNEDDRADGLRGILPDRRRLHQLGERQRRARRTGARLRRGLARRLRARHHRPRPAALRASVRALSQSRTRVDARFRHRLLPGRPRSRHRLREA